LSDLGSLFAQQDVGDSIILFGDMNGDIHHSSLHSFMTEHHPQESILSQFLTLLSLATFQRGHRSGTTPINGIWVLADVHVAFAQWCPIQTSPGDLCAIILEINLIECIGEPHYTIICPPGHHLNGTISSTHKKYLYLLTEFTSEHALSQKLESLFLLAHSPTTSKEDLQSALETFDHLKAKGMKFAEKHCRKLNMGLAQYSLELYLWRQRTSVWQLVVHRKQGHPIKAKYINWLACAGQMENSLGASTSQASHAFR